MRKLIALLLFASLPLFADTYAIKAARMIDGTGAAPVANATVLVTDNKIVAAGRDVAIPSGTLTIDFAEGGNTPSASWHQYGLSNEVVPEPAGLGVLAIGALGLLRRRRAK